MVAGLPGSNCGCKAECEDARPLEVISRRVENAVSIVSEMENRTYVAIERVLGQTSCEKEDEQRVNPGGTIPNLGKTVEDLNDRVDKLLDLLTRFFDQL